MPPEPKPEEANKEKRVEIRLDAELERRAREKAESRGWTLSSVIRALLGTWVDEDMVDPADVGKAAKRAPRTGSSATGS